MGTNPVSQPQRWEAPSPSSLWQGSFKTWPKLRLRALWKLVWKALLDTHVSPLNVSVITKTVFPSAWGSFLVLLPSLSQQKLWFPTPASYHKPESSLLHTVPPVTTPPSSIKSDRIRSEKEKTQVEYRVRLLTWRARHVLESTPDVSWTITKNLHFITF